MGRGGAQCAAGVHIRCTACLQTAVEDALADCAVRTDGALVCGCSGGGGVFAHPAFRDLLPVALNDRWMRTTTVQDFLAGEIALREHRKSLNPVDGEVPCLLVFTCFATTALYTQPRSGSQTDSQIQQLVSQLSFSLKWSVYGVELFVGLLLC
jgi:hypothetical protein